jgi:hypothetical protein
MLLYFISVRHPRLTYSSRVAEMEEKIDGLVALLASIKGNASVEDALREDVPGTASRTLSEDPSSMNSLLEHSPDQGTTIISQFHSHGPRPTQPWPVAGPFLCAPFPDYVFNELQDPISKNILSFDQAEEFMKDFRLKESSFPWIHLPKQTSLDTLRRERPFLTLAILTITTQHDLKIQEQLEIELKTSLMTKLLGQGEKSLDLLQGMLIYLSWYDGSL